MSDEGVFEETNGPFSNNSLADAQVAHQTAQDGLTGIQSVMWYGITSILNAAIPGALFLGLDNYPNINVYKWVVVSHTAAYWPVAFGWIAIALFDSDFSRELYKAMISISVLAPFVGNIVGYIFMFIHADNYGLWNTWAFWVMWPLYLAYEAGQMMLVFFFLPSIYDYIKTEPLHTKEWKDRKRKEEDEAIIDIDIEVDL